MNYSIIYYGYYDYTNPKFSDVPNPYFLKIICLGNVSWILSDSQKEFGIFKSTTKVSQGPNNPGIVEFGDCGPSSNKTKK